MIAKLSFHQAARSGALTPLWSAWRDRMQRAAASVPSSTTQALPMHATVRVSAAPGARIDCLEGCIWVTVDGDRRDVIVEAGGSFAFDRRGRALVHALERARVRLTGAAA
jgi:Protein of unknown function (DUF2917)